MAYTGFSRGAVLTLRVQKNETRCVVNYNFRGEMTLPCAYHCRAVKFIYPIHSSLTRLGHLIVLKTFYHLSCRLLVNLYYFNFHSTESVVQSPGDVWLSNIQQTTNHMHNLIWPCSAAKALIYLYN